MRLEFWCTNDKRESETKNEFFAAVGVNVASKLMHFNKHPVEYIYRMTPMINQREITNEKIYRKMRKRNSNKVNGPDGITTKEVKITAEEHTKRAVNS